MPVDAKEKLEAAYRAHGVTQDPLLDSYVRGCDLGQPVEDFNLAPGDSFAVYVKDGTQAGKHAAPINVRPETLGIIMEGRHREVYDVVDSLIVVRCTAADFPIGLVANVGGSGGGIQYVLPPGWQSRVKRLS